MLEEWWTEQINTNYFFPHCLGLTEHSKEKNQFTEETHPSVRCSCISCLPQMWALHLTGSVSVGWILMLNQSVTKADSWPQNSRHKACAFKGVMSACLRPPAGLYRRAGEANICISSKEERLQWLQTTSLAWFVFRTPVDLCGHEAVREPTQMQANPSKSTRIEN